MKNNLIHDLLTRVRENIFGSPPNVKNDQMPCPIHPLPSLRGGISSVATYAFYLVAVRSYFLGLDSSPSTSSLAFLGFVSSALKSAGKENLLPYLPTLSTSRDELSMFGTLLFVVLLPRAFASCVTLSATHFPSIAPPYVSTVLGSFEHDHDKCLEADGCPEDVRERRREAFRGLIDKLEKLFPKSSKM